MSASDARDIRRVKANADHDKVELMAEIKDDYGTITSEDVLSLPRHELMVAAARYGAKPTSDDGRWMSMTNDDIYKAMARVSGHEFITPSDAHSDPDEQQADVSGEESAEDGDTDGTVEVNGERVDLEQQNKDGLEQLAEQLEGVKQDAQQEMDELDGQEFEYKDEGGDELPEDADIDDKIEHYRKELERKAEAQQQWEQEQLKRKQELQDIHSKAQEAQRQIRDEQAKRDREPDEKQIEKAEQRAEEQKQTRESMKTHMPEVHHKELARVLDAVACGHNVYLAGPPGTGKSYLTEQVAQILGWNYASMSYGPSTPESRIWGYKDAHGVYHATPFRWAYEGWEASGERGEVNKSWVFCGDEIDNGNTGIVTSKNQALAGEGVTFPDGWVERHRPSAIMVTANTWGYGATAEFMGRNPLDRAFLNRFTKFEILIDEDMEEAMVTLKGAALRKRTRNTWINAVRKVRENADEKNIKVVVSPRDAADGAQLLQLGWTPLEVMKARFLEGLPESRVDNLLQGVNTDFVVA